MFRCRGKGRSSYFTCTPYCHREGGCEMQLRQTVGETTLFSQGLSTLCVALGSLQVCMELHSKALLREGLRRSFFTHSLFFSFVLPNPNKTTVLRRSQFPVAEVWNVNEDFLFCILLDEYSPNIITFIFRAQLWCSMQILFFFCSICSSASFIFRCFVSIC